MTEFVLSDVERQRITDYLAASDRIRDEMVAACIPSLPNDVEAYLAGDSAVSILRAWVARGYEPLETDAYRRRCPGSPWRALV